MTIHVRTRVHDQTLVVDLDGVADAALLAMVTDGIAALLPHGGRTVVDLNGLMITGVDAARVLVARLVDTGEQVGFASGRLSSRRILRRSGGAEVPIFPDLTTALEWASPATAPAAAVAC